MIWPSLSAASAPVKKSPTLLTTVAIFAIAQNQRGTSRAYNTVMESLNRVQSTVDVASAAAGVVSDLLLQMKEKALAAVDASTDATSRSILNTDYKALRDQITKAVNNASFNGVNMLSGTAGATISALANDAGTSKLTVVGKSMNSRQRQRHRDGYQLLQLGGYGLDCPGLGERLDHQRLQRPGILRYGFADRRSASRLHLEAAGRR